MTGDNHGKNAGSADAFVRGAQSKQTGLVGEMLAFLRHTRKWWLAPVIVLLLLMGGLAILGGSAVAPLIYTLF